MAAINVKEIDLRLSLRCKFLRFPGVFQRKKLIP